MDLGTAETLFRFFDASQLVVVTPYKLVICQANRPLVSRNQATLCSYDPISNRMILSTLIIPNHPNIPPELAKLHLDHPLNLEPALGHIEQGFVVSGGILAADEKNRWARSDLLRPEGEAYFAADAAQLANEVVERLLAGTAVD